MSESTIRRIAINTGGGDAPGLNAVIRAATLAALHEGWEVLGIRRGYLGLLDTSQLVPLTHDTVRGITHVGGSILGTNNRGNPLAIAHALYQKGLPVIGVPKTIDNDLRATDVTFGFQTAVEVATDAIGRLHSTAEAHQRIMVVQVMGRHTGWIALESGMAGGADVILIPEIPYRLEAIARKVREREAHGRRFSIVVVAEGAIPAGGEPSYVDGTGRYGGIADRLADELQVVCGKETRPMVLGHIQRGGSPIAYDRNLALRFGAAAVRCIRDGHLGTMVALQGASIRSVPLAEAVSAVKTVPTDADMVISARQLGISLGD